jgi:hypothetical protein
MSTLPRASEPARPVPASEPPHSAKSKPRRLLACVLCQQRKVKCDHNYPCATCVKARVQCVQAVQASRRRRRQFPEKELLVRLRQYESLLSQHNIQFEPLYPSSHSAEDKNSPASAGKASCDSEDEDLAKSNPVANDTSTPIPQRTKVEAKYILSENCNRVASRAN